MHESHGTTPAEHAGFHHQGPLGHRFEDAAAWSQVFDDPARAEWQRPDEVVAALVTRDDLAVGDLGAGTGYFSVRFAKAVPKGRVVGLDIEPTMVAYLNERAAKEGEPNLSAVAVDTEGGGMPGDLDLLFVCNTYHHIADRPAYFRRATANLAKGGRVAIVDFRVDSDRGPPKEHKLAPETVIAEMKAAGLELVGQHDFLPDQYILVFAPPAS
ncbi:MAG: methyltransferase domain-containing protein [Deltaproteobacteria bacterium]|nr:methyltransferase domain-containing protein [Deltaproteobacteria bacterium]